MDWGPTDVLFYLLLNLTTKTTPVRVMSFWDFSVGVYGFTYDRTLHIAEYTLGCDKFHTMREYKDCAFVHSDKFNELCAVKDTITAFISFGDICVISDALATGESILEVDNYYGDYDNIDSFLDFVCKYGTIWQSSAPKMSKEFSLWTFHGLDVMDSTVLSYRINGLFYNLADVNIVGSNGKYYPMPAGVGRMLVFNEDHYYLSVNMSMAEQVKYLHSRWNDHNNWDDAIASLETLHPIYDNKPNGVYCRDGSDTGASTTQPLPTTGDSSVDATTDIQIVTDDPTVMSIDEESPDTVQNESDGVHDDNDDPTSQVAIIIVGVVLTVVILAVSSGVVVHLVARHRKERREFEDATEIEMIMNGINV